jgi:hypothetical protein
LPLSASYFVSRSTIATALTVRRTSSSLVCQLQTLTRIALMPRQVVAVKRFAGCRDGGDYVIGPVVMYSTSLPVLFPPTLLAQN